MATYIARSTLNKLVVIKEGLGQEDEILRYLNRGPDWTIYRVSAAGNGSYTLTPQKIAAGTEVTTPVITAATLEDDV
jgi:hypothetical protein